MPRELMIQGQTIARIGTSVALSEIIAILPENPTRKDMRGAKSSFRSKSEYLYGISAFRLVA